MDLDDYGIQLDEDGRLVGFQAGKAAALLEWRHRKEAEEFRRLAKRLAVRKWKKQNPEKLAAQRARLYRANLEFNRLLKRIVGRNRSRRLAHTSSRECANCGHRWVYSTNHGGRDEVRRRDRMRARKYCSERCAKYASTAALLKRVGAARVRRPLSDDNKRQIVDGFMAGKSKVALAMEFGTYRNKISELIAQSQCAIDRNAIASAAGVPLSSLRVRPGPISSERRAAVIRAILDGYSRNRIIGALSITTETLGRISAELDA